MKLLKHEMKKLLFNKVKLLLLAAMFIFYAVLGWGVSAGNAGAAEYDRLIVENTGKLNQQQYEESKEIYKAAVDKYGTGEPLAVQVNRYPVLRFHSLYVRFGQSVDAYWNGPEKQNPDDILGVYLLQEKLEELENANQTNSYEYRLYKMRLNTELAYGEPYFTQSYYWNIYFVAFEAILVIFFAMAAIAFFISPVFSQEVKTEMDSIILCSVKGRREIVTAKLLSAGITSAIIAAVYLIGYFAGTWITVGDLSGFDAPIRSLGGFGLSALNVMAGEMAIISALWLILVASAFGVTLTLISALVKNQSAAFGLGIAVLFAGALSNSLGNMPQFLHPLIYFNFSTMSMFNTVFGGNRIFNLLGTPVSYGMMAFIVCLALGALACLLTYIAQKKRSVV